MKILSVFDGMACGMLAMLQSGVNVERYVAYEIDKYAVKTAQHNFPMIEEKGDVFDADFTEYKGFDFLVGGSPCTYWSIAQTKNRETEASGMGWELFSQYVRALKEAEPKYFIYENNKSMSKAIRESITNTFGFEPICINSALVSAQNRQRLYWVGIRQTDGTYRKANVEQPEDKGILLNDILEIGGVAWMDKAHTIDATYYKGGTLNSDKLHQNASRLMVAEPIRIPDYGLKDKSRPVEATYPNHSGVGEGSLEQGLFSDNKCKQQVDLIAEPVCLNSKVGGVQPVNQTDQGKNQTLKAQYAKNSIMNFIGYASTYGATGVAELIRVGTMPSPDGTLKGGQAMRIYSDDGKACPISTGQTKTGFYASQIPECFRVKEATKQGYTDINVGGVR